MAEKEKPTALGPVGQTLAGNIKRVRESQRLTYVELSKRLTETGRPIAVLGLRRIERGDRRIDVDDLFALAEVLRIHPVDLLVPPDAADDEPYRITPEMTTTASKAREWIAGMGFLHPIESPRDLAEAIQSMPAARAQEISRQWLLPREHELNRAALRETRPGLYSFGKFVPTDTDEPEQGRDEE